MEECPDRDPEGRRKLNGKYFFLNFVSINLVLLEYEKIPQIYFVLYNNEFKVI